MRVGDAGIYGLRHAGRARFRRDDPAGHRRRHEIARGQSWHRSACRNRAAAAPGAPPRRGRATASAPSFSALEQAPDHLDRLDRPHRKIGDRALGGALSLTHAFAQERGRRISLGKRVDGHDARKHDLPTGDTSNCNDVQGDIGLIATQPKTTWPFAVIAEPGTCSRYGPGNVGLERFPDPTKVESALVACTG